MRKDEEIKLLAKVPLAIVKFNYCSGDDKSDIAWKIYRKDNQSVFEFQKCEFQSWMSSKIRSKFISICADIMTRAVVMKYEDDLTYILIHEWNLFIKPQIEDKYCRRRL